MREDQGLDTTRKAGRPQNGGRAKRHFTVALTSEQLAVVQRRAQKAGLSHHAWVQRELESRISKPRPGEGTRRRKRREEESR